MTVEPLRVTVEELEAFEVAYVRHIGPYKGDGKLFERLFSKLFKWAGARGLLGPGVKTLVIYHDNPEITDEQKLRISVCVQVPDGTPVDGEIGKMTMPEGKYASLRFLLGQEDYQAAWNHVFGVRLPDSGYQPDDRPCYEIGLSNVRERPDNKHLVDICVAVRPL